MGFQACFQHEAQQSDPLVPEVPQILAAVCQDVVRSTSSQEASEDCSRQEGCRCRPSASHWVCAPRCAPTNREVQQQDRIGRGFSLAELKALKIGKLEARSLGIAEDPRRRNRSVQGKQANEQRLREYKAKLVVFPRKGSQAKKGWADDASAAELEVAEQTKGKVMPLVAEAPVQE